MTALMGAVVIGCDRLALCANDLLSGPEERPLPTGVFGFVAADGGVGREDVGGAAASKAMGQIRGLKETAATLVSSCGAVRVRSRRSPGCALQQVQQPVLPALDQRDPYLAKWSRGILAVPSAVSTCSASTLRITSAVVGRRPGRALRARRGSAGSGPRRGRRTLPAGPGRPAQSRRRR